MFSSAFPLAPVFAFLNNIFEIRVDAAKLCFFYRRPMCVIITVFTKNLARMLTLRTCLFLFLVQVHPLHWDRRVANPDESSVCSCRDCQLCATVEVQEPGISAHMSLCGDLGVCSLNPPQSVSSSCAGTGHSIARAGFRDGVLCNHQLCSRVS